MKQIISIFNENLNIALSSLKINKSRTFLSMLGIIIGISAVIIVTSIGNSATANIKESINSMGTSTISIFANFRSKNSGTIAQTVFNNQFTENIKKDIPAIKYAIPSISKSVNVSYNENYESFNLKPINENWTDINSYSTQYGTFINDSDYNGYKCVIGHEVYEILFEASNPVGKSITLTITTEGITRKINFKVIGVMESKSQTMISNFDSDIYINYDLYNNKIQKINNFTRFVIVGEISEQTSNLKTVIEHYLYNKGSNIGETQKEYFKIYTMSDMLETYDNITNILNLLLGGIAAISIIVGGIGIMNIMLVSVTERTKEIGIRKAIGAKKSYIFQQFLIEASLISIIGGLIGIILGIIITYIATLILQWPFTINWFAMIIAIIFSIAIGEFFGFNPARRAANLNPIEALTYE